MYSKVVGVINGYPPEAGNKQKKDRKSRIFPERNYLRDLVQGFGGRVKMHLVFRLPCLQVSRAQAKERIKIIKKKERKKEKEQKRRKKKFNIILG